jgi:DNA-binding IscR family transcriptional regulator
VLDIIEAVDGPMNTRPPFAEGMAGESESRLREALCTIASTARKQLDDIKVAHLIAPRKLEKQLTG